MQLAAAEQCGDFDAADRFKFRVPRGGFAEFSETGDGVVVGQGGGFEAGCVELGRFKRREKR